MSAPNFLKLGNWHGSCIFIPNLCRNYDSEQREKIILKFGPFLVDFWPFLINMVIFSKLILCNFLVEIHQTKKCFLSLQVNDNIPANFWSARCKF